MKVLSTLRADDDNITIAKIHFDSLFAGLADKIHFFQSEYNTLI